MKENKISIEINRPVSEVFAFTLNPKNTHLWIDTIVREEANQHPVGVGTKYKNVNSQGQWTEYTVIRIQQNKLFEMKQSNSTYHVLYTFEQLSEGKTKLTYFEWVEDGDLDGPFSLTFLEKLKKLMEEIMKARLYEN